jgi:glutaredoxin
MSMQLILYSKPGCHLCEGLQEKLEQVQQNLYFELEIRDITTREDWFQAYQYEIPVLFVASGKAIIPTENKPKELLLPRPSPRATPRQLENLLRKYLQP